MENSLLVTLSAQAALQRQLDIVASNLANINTTGFKRAGMLFETFVAPAAAKPAARGGMPVFVRDVATIADHRPGQLEATGNPLDVAIRGDGYLVVQGAEGELYSRNGHFRLDDTGQIVTEDGLPVLGVGGTPIVVPSDHAQITVSADGSISSEQGDLGRLRLVSFDNPQALAPVGAGLWRTEEEPVELDHPVVVQGMLERSNVQPIVEIEHLIRVHRAYDQAKQLADREDERIRKMIQAYAA